MLPILNQYSNLIVAGTTAILVVVTICYAVFTRRLVKETIRTREADLRPYIIVDTTLRGLRFYLVIRNGGRLPAEKLHFTFDKSVENMWTRKIEEISLFKNGIEILMPGKEYVVSLGPSQLYLNKDADTVKYPAYFSIDVEYSYFQGIRKQKEKFIINLEEYRNTERFPDELVKTIEFLSSSMNRGTEWRDVHKIIKLHILPMIFLCSLLGMRRKNMSITLSQILALVGKLDESPGDDTPRERIRRFLKENVSEVGQVRDYIEECLRTSGDQYNRALQDLVNYLGNKMGSDLNIQHFLILDYFVGFSFITM